ncbi:uncharacterized protein [Panulirus ornatus]|uniref:uncharacterized protein n=1 Tax=Panulirus ornatus TaxID=150431 RepID=UPI003A886FDB
MECGGADSMEIIRQRARNNDHAFRLKKRSMVRDMHRLDLENITKKLKVPSTEEFSSLCSQLKKQKNIEILQRIRLGLSHSQKNVTVFFNSQGALYSLIGCLTGHDAGLQREAACTFVNLALGNEKQCMEICQRAGVYLILHMSNSNPELQDPAAWCIGNLCGTYAKVCNMLRTQGVEDSLVNLLKSHSPHVLQSAAYSLVQYLTTCSRENKCSPISVTLKITFLVLFSIILLISASWQTEDIRMSSPFSSFCWTVDGRHISEPSMLRRLIDALNQEGGTADIGWCLFVLSVNQEVCSLLVDQGIIQTSFTVLEKLMNEQNLNVSSVTSIVRLVMNCVGAVPGTAVQVCYRSEQLVQVVKALLYSPHPHLRIETVYLLANVVNAASKESVTGQCIIDDLSLRPRLESAVRSALAAKFTTGPPDTTSFMCNM